MAVTASVRRINSGGTCSVALRDEFYCSVRRILGLDAKVRVVSTVRMDSLYMNQVLARESLLGNIVARSQ